MIEWDPSAYTFDWNGQQTTVREYFREYYGIDLKYPNVRKWAIFAAAVVETSMLFTFICTHPLPQSVPRYLLLDAVSVPMSLASMKNRIICTHACGLPFACSLIRTSRLERFPSELLFQGLSASAAVSAIKTDDCLQFYDTFSGAKRLSHIDHVSKVSGLLQPPGRMGTLQEAFARLGLEVGAVQEKMKADVLKPPNLRFQGHHRETEISDGSWNVQWRPFLRGSRLHSFAVIRLSRPKTISDRNIESFFDQLQRMFDQKGMQLSFSSMSQHLVDNIVDVHPADSASLDVVSHSGLDGVSYFGRLLTCFLSLLLIFAVGPRSGGSPRTLLAKFPCGWDWDCSGETELGRCWKNCNHSGMSN